MKKVIVKCSGSRLVNFESLVPFQGELKTLSDANYEKLKKLILELGFSEPFAVWHHNGVDYILNGHQRFDTLSRMRAEGFSIPPLPIVDVQAENEREAKRKILSLTSQFGKMTEESLLAFSEQNNFDIDSIMNDFSFADLSSVSGGLLDEEESADTHGDDEVCDNASRMTKFGDLWELGENRLLCGDSTIDGNYKKLMGGELADLWLTDPPYNVNYEGKTKDAMKIENDSMGNDQFRKFLVDVFSLSKQYMKEGSSFYIWHADSEGYNFRGACFDIDLQVRQCLIWVKSMFALSRQDYHWKHEPCLYGWKAGASHNWFSDRTQTTLLEFDKPARNDIHPTMKPVDLYAYQIKNSCATGGLILDNFLGSGTAIIAALKTKRKCYGMELDPKYCDAIVKRYSDWCELNNRDVNIKLNGSEYFI